MLIPATTADFVSGPGGSEATAVSEQMDTKAVATHDLQRHIPVGDVRPCIEAPF
jgi:hypothetical protein